MMKNNDGYLKSVLENRDKDLGFNGDYTFEIKLVKEDKFLLRVPNLTRAAARKLFDQIDENNCVTDYLDIRILDKKNTEIDMNRLPNIHTK